MSSFFKAAHCDQKLERPRPLPITNSLQLDYFLPAKLSPAFVIKHFVVVFTSLGDHKDGIVSDVFTVLPLVPPYSRYSVNTTD